MASSSPGNGSEGSAVKVDLLRDVLSRALPTGSRARIRYLHSRTKKCEPLYSPLPNAKGEQTRQTSHLLTVSTDIITTGASKDTLTYAVEVFIYTTRRLTTVFVSKADSTGLRDKTNPIPIRPLTTAFLKWLVDREIARKPGRPLVVSLFGRAQEAYLFPGSPENQDKHVLDDRQLVKWWVKALDPLLRDQTSRHGFITVPGYHGSEVRQFLPAGQSHWTPGNPLQQLASIRGLPEHAPTRCLLPRFPDDPKARFMLDLDDEVGLQEDAGASAVLSPSKRKDGQWKTIHGLDRFWEAMEYRQECLSGRVVGFLWLVINAYGRYAEPVRESSPTPQTTATLEPEDGPTKTDKKKRKKRLKGRIPVRLARIKGSLTGANTNRTTDGNGVMLTHDGQSQLMQTLSRLDFAKPDIAAKSTRKWLSEVAVVAKAPLAAFTLNICGTAEIQTTSSASTIGSVNDLGSMIRKKKRPVEETLAVEAITVLPIVNTLGAGLIRKKAKAE